MKKLNRKSRAILYLIISAITVCLPFFGLVLFAILYFFADTRKSIIVTSIMFGVLVGFFAYNFIPDENYDLARHQEIVEQYETVNDYDSFVRVYESNDREPLSQVYSFLISRTGNVDLLQFFVVAIGYSALFYILADFRNKIDLDRVRFFVIFVLVLFGQHTLYYFSGLYNYVAINLFALAFYLDYFGKKRVIPYVIYFSSVFVHTSMILPLALVLLFKFNKNKLSKRLFFISIIAIVVGLLFLVNTRDTGGSGVGVLQTMFNGYSSNNNHYLRYYGGIGLIVDLVKIVLMVFAFRLTSVDKDKIEAERSFIVLSLPIITLLLPVSIVLIRLISLLFFISIPMMMSALKAHSDNAKAYYTICIASAFLFAWFNIRTIYPYGYKNFVIRKLPTTINEFFLKGDLGE